MGQSSDYSQATVLLLCIVIVLLYYLYRAKKRKLQQEEQKYIQKFLLPENIQRYSSSSPLKGSGFSPTRFRRVGEFNSPKQNRQPGKTQTKQSPAKKSQTVILDRSSPPSIDKKSLSPASRISGLKPDILQDTKWSPEKRMSKTTTASENLLKAFSTTSTKLQKSVEVRNSQETRAVDKDQSPKDKAIGQKTTKILREFENIKPFDGPSGEQPESSALRILPVPEKATASDSVDPQKNVKANEVINGKAKTNQAPAKKKEIAFLEPEDSLHIPQKDMSSSIKENKQYEIVSDSSFESDQETEEATQADNLPINKKQLLEKSKIDISELGKYGPSTSLKRYVAKKSVQERMRERPSPKSMDQFFRSTQVVSNVTAGTAKPTGLAAQSSHGANQAGVAKPATQGGLFPSNPTPKPTENSAKPAGQGLFPSSNKQNPAPSQNQNQNQAEAPKSTGLFGNAGATGGAQTGEQPKSQGLFGAAASKESAPQSNAQPGAVKEGAKPAQNNTTSSGGGLFGNLNKTGDSGSAQAQKPQDKPQVQTGGLFGKSVAPNQTAGASNPKASTPLFAAKDAGSRVGDIEDFAEGPLKKVLTK